MPHIVLLGDSVFDNAAYVGAGRSVLQHLQVSLGGSGQATLAAVDGAVASDISHQLRRVPATATHFVISVGGNDALRAASVLREGAQSVGGALDRLAAVQLQFRDSYIAMLDAVLVRNLPTAVCTIYNPRFPDAAERRRGTLGLTIFNDVILREGFARGVTLLDLRLVCDEDGDFANPIEPSDAGGRKIAEAVRAIPDLPLARPHVSRVIAGQGRP